MHEFPVRAVRDEAMKAIDKSEKDGDIGEDEKFSQREGCSQLLMMLTGL